MSKHVSLHSSRSISITYFYCVEGEVVESGGPFIKGDPEVSFLQFLELAGCSYLDDRIALANLQYLLRLDTVLQEIDTRPNRESGTDDISYLLRWGRGPGDFHKSFKGIERSQYLGKRPYACCSEMSSGGLARGKNDAS